MERFQIKKNKALFIGVLDNPTIAPLFHEIIASRLATLDDLYEKYSLFEAFQLYVIILTNAYNDMKIRENEIRLKRQQQ